STEPSLFFTTIMPFQPEDRLGELLVDLDLQGGCAVIAEVHHDAPRWMAQPDAADRDRRRGRPGRILEADVRRDGRSPCGSARGDANRRLEPHDQLRWAADGLTGL